MAKEEIKNDDQPEVEIVDDPAADIQDKSQPKIVTLEEGVDELKRKLEAQEQQTQEERNRRLQAEGRVQAVTIEKQEGEVAQVASAIATVTQRLEVARANYRSARASNDVDAELAATELIAQSRNDLSALESGKARIEARQKNPQPERVQYTDPVEALASTLEPQSAAWVRAHPDYARDAAKYNKMVAASNWAIANGHAPDTSSYFSEVEKMLGLDNGQAVTKAADPNPENPMSSASRAVPPAAAPVSRVATPGQSRPGTIRLTQQQAEVAEGSYPELSRVEAHRAYWRNLQDLKSQGRLN